MLNNAMFYKSLQKFDKYFQKFIGYYLFCSYYAAMLF